MTTGHDATEFVELEIAGRCRMLSDASKGDWVRAILRCGDIGVARQIVRELADDPDENWLSTKGFYRRLNKLSQEQDEPQGKADFVYGDGEFDVVATCPRIGLPDICIPLAYPTARRFGNGVIRAIPWTEDRLRDAMQHTFRGIRATYGGDWILSIWQAQRLSGCSDREIGAREKAEAMILAGPDTPGRRWLLGHQSQDLVNAVAAEIPSVQAIGDGGAVATREMIERLRAMPAATEGPKVFDPEDPELIDPEFAAACASKDLDDPDSY